MKKLSNLAWLDLEMTGLDPEKDVILEIAAIVTDKDLNILSDGISFVINQPERKLDLMNNFVKEMHTKSGLINEVLHSNVNLETALKKNLEYFDEFCFIGVTPLCGNSIWQDRRFLNKYMPELDSFFNYRIIDVSSVKEIVRKWYPESPVLKYIKKEGHRALPDIYESIAELNHYKMNFFIKPS